MVNQFLIPYFKYEHIAKNCQTSKSKKGPQNNNSNKKTETRNFDKNYYAG